MTLQILLETSLEITRIKNTESENICGQHTTIVLLPHSIVIINVSFMCH